MSTRSERLPAHVADWLHDASLLDIETVIRACAVELTARATPDTRVLFDYARVLERVRLFGRPADKT